MDNRKNQNTLTPAEWAAFIDAIAKTHGLGAKKPAYREFVKVHQRAMSMSDPIAMTWHVHSMGPMMPGTNFLAWHRRFVLRMEHRLQKEHPGVTIPYWDAITDRALPAALNTPALLSAWGVTRSWDAGWLASAGDLALVEQLGSFGMFQATIEGSVHGGVHNAVGGDMATSRSPADPLFWLHHANIDRIWAKWQAAHPGHNPPNPNETLKPSPLFGVKVSSVVDTAALGYRYQP